jgi:hypothetical protein
VRPLTLFALCRCRESSEPKKATVGDFGAALAVSHLRHPPALRLQIFSVVEGHATQFEAGTGSFISYEGFYLDDQPRVAGYRGLGFVIGRRSSFLGANRREPARGSFTDD